MKTIGFLIFIFFCFTGKNWGQTKDRPIFPKEGMDSSSFATVIEGKKVNLYTLHNGNITVYLSNHGARLVGLSVPDKNGSPTDIVLGLPKGADYNTSGGSLFGPIVGPYANRIANASFDLNGETYNLTTVNGRYAAHGGPHGVHRTVWDVDSLSATKIKFKCVLQDKYGGFPGNREIYVSYALTHRNELTISYEVTTDKVTVVNLSNHAYFNLNGEGSGSILGHQLQLFAEAFTPVDKSLIPTGEIQSVKENKPFDFTVLKAIGQDIETEDNIQLRYGKGYDHNFVLAKHKFSNLHHAARLVGDLSGIVMDIYSHEPGIQFYSGNFMSGKNTLKNGGRDEYRSGLCLEPQHFPDAPNQPAFPSTVLQPGQAYRTISVYRFSTVGQFNMK